MRIRVGGVVLSLVLGMQVVAAKPLPSSMKVFVKKGKPYLTTEKVTVQLVDNWSEWQEVKAELSDDGSELLLQRNMCNLGLEFDDSPLSLPMAVVNAKVENGKGMALHVKKKYAEAAKLFEQAAAHDPTTPVYATNLLSALAMGGEVERANKLLDDGMGKDQVAWFAWRLSVDPELKKLKDLSGAKRFRVDKPGKLTSKKLGGVAASPLGVAAIETSDSYGKTFVSFVQLSTGAETLRLPVKQRKDIDALFASMGFEVTSKKVAWSDEIEKLPVKIPDDIDPKAVAISGKYIVYIARDGGCDVSEFDFHAGAAPYVKK